MKYWLHTVSACHPRYLRSANPIVPVLMNVNKLLSQAFRSRFLTQQAYTKPRIFSSRTMSDSAPANTLKTPEQVSAEQHEQNATPLPLSAPTTDSITTTIDMSNGGNTVKLDHLGPLVVNKDGTLSRIANWETMAEIERQNTLRILGKRNQLRMEGLRNAQEGAGK